MMDNLDLIHYIEQARKSGMKDNQIREGLIQAGWPVSSVDEAIMKAPSAGVPAVKPRALMPKSLAKIFIIISLAVAGYFAGAYYMTHFQRFPLWPFEASVPPVPTFTPRPSSIHTLDTSAGLVQVPADWKTYRNEEYGFELKYPENWEANSDFPNRRSGEFQISFRDEKYKNALDWTGLILQSYPDKNSDYIQNQSFSSDNMESLIKYKIDSSFIYGSCTNYGDDITDMCNQVLSTFKFTEGSM